MALSIIQGSPDPNRPMSKGNLDSFCVLIRQSKITYLNVNLIAYRTSVICESILSFVVNFLHFNSFISIIVASPSHLSRRILLSLANNYRGGQSEEHELSS